MSPRFWSFCLQWTRVGIGAVVFLIAARHLTLAEIGAFATAYAPIRLTQGLHKAGIAETVIILGHRPARLDSLFALSLTAGMLLSAAFLATSFVITSPMLMALAIIPLLNASGAVPDGLLRKSLRLRALALRTLATQTIAAAIALWLLSTGAGVWALVVFALVNALLTNLIALTLAKWRPASWPSWSQQALIWPKTAQIAGRDFLANALFPLAQLAIAASFGLTAAGAFQIATRILSLIDALAISPLRYIALPDLSKAQKATFIQTLQAQLRLTIPLSAWIWGGTFAAAPHILTLAVGPDHASDVTPLLRALSLLGLCSALSMPLTQALTAKGHTALVLTRAAVMLAAAATLALPALLISPTATALALSLGALITTTWYIGTALPRLGLTAQALIPHAIPLLAAATMALALLTLQNVITFPALEALTIQILAGTALFLGLLHLTRRALP